MSSENLGIIVSGGPAPGINTVIASTTIQACENGMKVFGFQRGFLGIVKDGEKSIRELKTENVTAIALKGGSILGTSRYNPFETKESEEKLFKILNDNKINKLVVIGGEGSAFLSYKISQKLPRIQIAHIPKTIDNDLILPNKHPSFGFETARLVGTNILKTIINEAKTTTRWFIVRTMGRKAGFLAQGMGIAAGATLTIIGEQFDDRDTLEVDDLAQMVFSSIKNRLKIGKDYGTAVLSEGLLDKLNPQTCAELNNSPQDDMGRMRFAEISLEDIVARRVRELLRKEKINMRVSVNSIGYELRCHDPVPFDVEYTRLLAYGAIKYLLEDLGSFMVVRDFNNLAYVPLDHMIDEQTGLIRSRKVDLNSDIYKAANSFMVK